MSPIMKYFAFAHLPEKLQEVSKPIGELAAKMDADIPDGAEKSAGLRKLLEAKDCLVRAILPLFLLVLLCGCVSPSDQSAVSSVPRAGWIDVKIANVADRSIDRARTTILVPALQGMVDGLKDQRQVSAVSVGVLVNEPVKAEPVKEPETDQPDDLLTVRECTPTQCFGIFQIRRKDLSASEQGATGRGRKLSIISVVKTKSVVKTASACTCEVCRCGPLCDGYKVSVSANRGESAATFTTTYRTRYRLFNRWRR